MGHLWLEKQTCLLIWFVQMQLRTYDIENIKALVNLETLLPFVPDALNTRIISKIQVMLLNKLLLNVFTAYEWNTFLKRVI